MKNQAHQIHEPERPTPQRDAETYLDNARNPAQGQHGWIWAAWCGVSSFIADITVEANPFERNSESDLWKWWNRGWMGAKENADRMAELAALAEEKKPYWQKF